MANRNQVQTSRSLFSLRNLVFAAGAAILIPYLVRRVLPLLDRGLANVTGNDIALAGKDSLRDAADDFNVGGIKGRVNRTVGRVADHLRTDV